MYREVKLVAVVNRDDKKMISWKQLLDREKIQYTDNIEDFTRLVITNRPLDDELFAYVENGGVCIAEDQTDVERLKMIYDEPVLVNELHFEEYGLCPITYPNTASSYIIDGEYEGIGYFRTHEKRIVKTGGDVGKKPIFIRFKLGKGTLYISAVNFDNYFNINGDILRPINNRAVAPKINERVSQIDKGNISIVLRDLIRNIFRENDLPLFEVNYFPDKADKIFIFRMDLDGIDNDHTISDVARLCEKYGIPGSFFANKNYLIDSPEYAKQLSDIQGRSVIGNHGVIHNVFDTVEQNEKNIRDCDEWMRSLGIEPKGFVAPRGIWNSALNDALEKIGKDYSSDFGIDFNDLPFRPYYHNRYSKVLQVPVNAYSAGRHNLFNAESGLADITDDDVIAYYEEYIKDCVEHGYGYVHIYGHPMGLGKHLNALEHIFRKVTDEGFLIISIAEFKDWWIKREEIGYTLYEGVNDYNLIVDEKDLDHFKLLSDNIHITKRGGENI